jgi:uncharacterized membrane protein YhaH (DUF805 family)
MPRISLRSMRATRANAEATMDWPHLFTSIEGRISRRSFWIALLCLSVPELVAHVTLGERWSSIVSLLIAYPEFAVFAKRGHDRNVPTWVAGVFIAGAIVLNLMALLDLSGPMTNPTTLFYIVGVPVGIIGLILLIDFGFRRGTAGPNHYGPDPLAMQQPTQ